MRRRRSPLYAVKETVAALNEELEFTLNYAEALSRDRSYKAVVEVIEEQRRSLERASERMQVAVTEPERPRTRSRVSVAIAGVAAAVAIASSAVAAFGPVAHRTPEVNPRIAAITRATETLTQTINVRDPAAVQALVIAQQTILEVAQASPNDPNLTVPLLDSLEKLRALARNTSLPAGVRAQARKVADTVKKIVVAVPDSTSTSAPSSSSSSSSTSTSAPTTAPSSTPSTSSSNPQPRATPGG